MSILTSWSTGQPYCSGRQAEGPRCECVSSGRWTHHTTSLSRAAWSHKHMGTRLQFPSYYGIKPGKEDCVECEGHGFYWSFSSAWCIVNCFCSKRGSQ